ncbi:hypothetical protein E5288_WYG019940 [Bos mutus]|uniref:Uncharacterized protein n=1 Tax=Bos mutus TaxID=72004 RepID=A0A6B0RI29_9CETA|nr:hypothetical protein [Bos mutus]
MAVSFQKSEDKGDHSCRPYRLAPPGMRKGRWSVESVWKVKQRPSSSGAHEVVNSILKISTGGKFLYKPQWGLEIEDLKGFVSHLWKNPSLSLMRRHVFNACEEAMVMSSRKTLVPLWSLFLAVCPEEGVPCHVQSVTAAGDVLVLLTPERPRGISFCFVPECTWPPSPGNKSKHSTCCYPHSCAREMSL